MSPKTETSEDLADAGEATSESWEPVKVGLGKEWDLEKSGPLIAYYVDATDVAIEKEGDERTSARARLFALPEGGEQVFLWDSYELAVALEQVAAGEKVRITFLGRESYSSENGPRQVKRYKVERATPPAA